MSILQLVQKFIGDRLDLLLPITGFAEWMLAPLIFEGKKLLFIWLWVGAFKVILISDFFEPVSFPLHSIIAGFYLVLTCREFSISIRQPLLECREGEPRYPSETLLTAPVAKARLVKCPRRRLVCGT